MELGKEYGVSNLKRMRQFYLLIEKGATMSHQITWSHYYEIISLNDIYKINYYIEIIEKYNLSIRQLRVRIKNNEYERLPEETKNRIISKTESSVIDYVKNPILIKNKYNTNDISEKVLQQLILEDIESFMNELYRY